MKANERRQALLEHLCEVRQSTLENLAFHFSVSQSTIRRDVLELSLSYPHYKGSYVLDIQQECKNIQPIRIFRYHN